MLRNGSRKLAPRAATGWIRACRAQQRGPSAPFKTLARAPISPYNLSPGHTRTRLPPLIGGSCAEAPRWTAHGRTRMKCIEHVRYGIVLQISENCRAECADANLSIVNFMDVSSI